MTRKSGGRGVSPKRQEANPSAQSGAGIQSTQLDDLGLSPTDWEAVEEAFRAWQARNDHALTMGGTGDLVDLVFALRAACAKR